MELRDLEYLVTSAEVGNFGRAAKAFGLDISTICRRISRLEDELGLALFERRHSGVQLTQGGRSILVHVRRALLELEQVKRSGARIGSGTCGEIRLGVHIAPIGEAVVGLLRRWHERHANVAVTLSELNSRDLPAALEERRVDLVLSPRHCASANAARMAVFRERIFSALPFGHHLAQEQTTHWEGLRRETILVPAWGGDQGQRELYAHYVGQDVHFEVHAASKQSILALVGAGAGVTLVTESQTRTAFPNVVFKPIDEDNAWLDVDLVWRAEMEDPVVGRFVAFMRDE